MNYPEFKAPEGLDLEGETGEAMVMWKRKPNGNICITSIDGISLDKSEDGERDDLDYNGKLDALAASNSSEPSDSMGEGY